MVRDSRGGIRHTTLCRRSESNDDILKVIAKVDLYCDRCVITGTVPVLPIWETPVAGRE